MANVSGAVQIETGIKHGLSIPFQSVAGRTIDRRWDTTDENHCLIEGRNASGNDITLSVTCYEFWENFAKGIEGSEVKIKLTQGQKGRLIIDGVPYQRCAARPTLSNAAPNVRPNAPGATIAAGPLKSSETLEKDRASEEQIKYGACTR